MFLLKKLPFDFFQQTLKFRLFASFSFFHEIWADLGKSFILKLERVRTRVLQAWELESARNLHLIYHFYSHCTRKRKEKANTHKGLFTQITKSRGEEEGVRNWCCSLPSKYNQRGLCPNNTMRSRKKNLWSEILKWAPRPELENRLVL